MEKLVVRDFSVFGRDIKKACQDILDLADMGHVVTVYPANTSWNGTSVAALLYEARLHYCDNSMNGKYAVYVCSSYSEKVAENERYLLYVNIMLSDEWIESIKSKDEPKEVVKIERVDKRCF